MKASGSQKPGRSTSPAKGTPHAHDGQCRELLERLSLYVDGDLSPAQSRKLEAHLRDCPCCEEFAESLRRTVEACRTEGKRRLPADVRARAKARIHELITYGR